MPHLQNPNICWSTDNIVSIMIRVWVGWTGIWIPPRARYFPLLTTCRLALRPSGLLLNGHHGFFSWVFYTWAWDHSTPSRAQVKKKWHSTHWHNLVMPIISYISITLKAQQGCQTLKLQLYFHSYVLTLTLYPFTVK